MITRRLAPVLAATLVSVLLLVSGAVAQQVGLDVRLVDTELEADGRTALYVVVDGEAVGDEGVPADAFTVTENGEEVGTLRVAPVIEEAEPPQRTVMIAFDVSGSAAGAPVAAAKEAAIGFVERVVPDGVEVGLVPFSTSAELAVAPTDDLDVLIDAIGQLDAAGNTALYDAMVLAAAELEGREGEQAIVLFTDGADTSSTASLDEAVAAPAAVGAPVYNVALITPDQDPEVLAALAAGPDDRLLEVDQLDELEEAFAQVARSLTAQYVLRYSNDLLSDELDLTVTVVHAGEEGSVQVVLLNPREAVEAVAPPPPTPVEPRPMGRLGEPLVLAGALAATFLALALLFGALFVPWGDRAASRTLRRGVTMLQRTETSRVPAGTGLSSSSLGRAAVDLVSMAPRPEGYDDRLQTEIDRAGWQLRASEFTAIRVMGAVAGLAVLWALTGAWWMGVVGAVLGGIGPRLFLSSAKSRRQARFMQQLPDTLQLLAGTLKAGYGVLQAIDTVVREVEEPTASEFQRALTEARLGLPLEDSLGEMADRVESDDFRWVVVAMNIQRQVGGNLAELLETVAATLRGRDQVRRQISALSAEGKLSAAILIALPFVILGFLLVTNPGYLTPLFTNVMGWFMLGSVAVLMAAGVVWIRKMIAIDV